MATRLPVLLLALLLVLSAASLNPPPARAEHGGPGVGSLLECNRPVVPPRCVSVGNDRRHYIVIDASVPPDLASSFRAAMGLYDATEMVLIEQQAVSSSTDAIVYASDEGANGAAGWVFCPADAPQGINPFGDRWCQRQEIHFNLNARYFAFFADDASRVHLSCHELGHSVGLRHWGNPPSTDPPAAATCMNADTPNGPPQLHQADRDHLDAYYAQLAPVAVPVSALRVWSRLRLDADLGSHLIGGHIGAAGRAPGWWRAALRSG